MSVCAGCHAGCCRSFAVPVTGADILRIERDSELSFWDFVCRWADPQGTIAQKYAPHFHFADEPETPFVICLRQTESVFFPRTSKCRFLREGAPSPEQPLGEARCGVYGCRPAACRVFPTKFSRSGQLAVLTDVPCRGRSGEEPLYSLCPRPWEPRDVDPVAALQDLVVARFEMNFFHQLADGWNRRPGQWEVFPDFLRLIYSRRVGREPPAEAAEQQPVPAPHRSPMAKSRLS